MRRTRQRAGAGNGILGLLAGELGMVRPLARVSTTEVIDDIERLWGAAEPAVPRDR